MNRDDFTVLVRDLCGVEPDHPFADDMTTAVFRHANNRKWFALMMTISKSRLGIQEDGMIDVVNLKCAREVMDTLFQEEKGIYPAYHMNKNHWITVLLDGTVSDNTLQWLLSISYDLTKVKIKAKK